MYFSEPTGRTGIIEQIENKTNTQSTTSSSYPLTVKTQDVNDAYNWYFMLAIKYSGRWQVDDTNHPDYPILRSDINAFQFDYPFLTDTDVPPNDILDMYQIRVKDSSGNFKVIRMIDRTDPDDISRFDGKTGIPEVYDITSNGIMLFPTPNYSMIQGLEIYTARTPQQFLSTDTNKEAGIPKMFQPYLWMRPAYLYCSIKNLPQTKALQDMVIGMENGIKQYHSTRTRMEKPRLRVSNRDSNK